MFDFAKVLKFTVKDVPMNNDELLNIQTCYVLCFETGAAPNR